MKNIIIISILFMIYYGCLGCKGLGEYFFEIQIDNNSDQVVSVCWSTEKVYPDTTFLNYHAEKDNNYYFINPMKNWGMGKLCKSDEDFMSNFPLDTMSIFVFSIDTINKYGWDKVREE